MLALVMVVSLAPMTAKAADPTVLDAQTISDVEAGSTGEYYYLPEGYGTYSVKVEGEGEFTVGIYDVPMSNMATQIVSTAGVVETEITTNMMLSSISLMVLNGSDSVQNYTVTVATATVEEPETGDATAITEIGTDAAPVVLEELGTYEVSLDQNDGLTYLKWTADATGNVSVVTNSGMGTFEINSVAGTEIYATEAEVTEGDVVIFKGMGMPGATVNVTFAVEEANESYQITEIGTYDAPVVLEGLGTYEISLGQDDGFTYLKWIADENGTLNITYSGMGMFEIYSVAGEEVHAETAEVNEGDVVIIQGTGMYGAVVSATFAMGESVATNVLVLGENAVNVTVNNYYCAGTDVTFTATEAGTYVLSAADGETNASVFTDNESVDLPYEFTLAANESITFKVATAAYMTLTEDTIDLVVTKKDSDNEGDSINALVLGENSVHVTVTDYFPNPTVVTFTATEAGTYTLAPVVGENNADVTVVNGDWIEEYPYEFTLAANESVSFEVVTAAYMTLTEDDIDLVITKKASGSEGGSGNEGDSEVGEDTDNEGAGTEEDPYVMIMGDNVVTFKEEGSYAYYVYTATEKGALLLTMSGDNTSWYYAGTVNGDNITQFINPNKSWETNQNSSTDAEPAALRTVYLNTGDKVLLTISTAENSEWTRPAGTVKFNAWFMAGAEPESDEVELEEYVIDDENMLQLGENTVELDPSAETTIFEFCPEEAGVYVFTTDNGVLGYWGATPNFVQDKTENKTNSLEYNLENAGPSIMVGVTGEGEATITVKKAGETETKPTIPTIVYSNVVVPEAMDEFEVALPNTVDINDDVKDTAVLGADGFYHLNTADGPVLFVNFESEAISFLEAYGYGRLNGVVTNDDDEVIAIVDYNEAFIEYYAAANEDGCYPLTEDLITILKEVGANESWYGEEGWIGGDPEEAWMFACCYADNNTSVDVELEEAETEDANVVIKDSGKVTAESLEAIIETTASDKVVFTVETEDATVTFEFVVEDMELVDGKETYDFSVELVDDYTDATEDEADIEEDGFVLRVNFSYEGKLPAAAVITIPVGDDYKNTTLYYYQILADGTLKYVCDAPVDANGNAKVTQDHCSDYVLLSEKVDEGTLTPGTPGTPETPEAPKTGDTTNFALWIAVLGLGVVAIAGSVVMKKREF